MSSILDNITDVKRLALNEGEVLVVKLPRNNLPTHIWEKNAGGLRDTLKLYFLTNRIIVVSDNVEMTVIKQEKQDAIS